MAKINAGNKENDISSLGGFSDGHSGNSGLSNLALHVFMNWNATFTAQYTP
jgi:hypothetical protein